MPNFVEKSLSSRWLWFIARCCVAILFLCSGLAKILDVEGSFQEMQAAGLEPAWFFNYASAFILLASTYCILFNQQIWLASLGLSIFLILTIAIVHTFWSMAGLEAKIALYFALEHVAVIGGLISLAIADHFRQKLHVIGAIQ